MRGKHKERGSRKVVLKKRGVPEKVVLKEGNEREGLQRRLS